MCVSYRPSTQHPTVSLACLCTQTLWTSTTVACQTSMRRILTHGTCLPLVWREAPLTPILATCSHPTWLLKVSSDFGCSHGSHVEAYFPFLWPVYFTTVALWLQCCQRLGFYSSYIHPKHTYKDKVRLFLTILH